jgi:hypothetical protein
MPAELAAGAGGARGRSAVFDRAIVTVETIERAAALASKSTRRSWRHLRIEHDGEEAYSLSRPERPGSSRRVSHGPVSQDPVMHEAGTVAGDRSWRR